MPKPDAQEQPQAREGGKEKTPSPALNEDPKQSELTFDAPEFETPDDDFQDDEKKAALKQLQQAAALDRVDQDLLPGF